MKAASGDCDERSAAAGADATLRPWWRWTGAVCAPGSATGSAARLCGIGAAGLLPVALHLYEVKKGKTEFSWGTVSVCLSVGGMAAISFGFILQAFLLLVCGVHSVFGLPIDWSFWKLPEPLGSSV